MVLSTVEIVLMVLLALLLLVALWWLAVAGKFRLYLGTQSYTRGANASEAGQTLNLTCDSDKEICVYRATQICTMPDSNNYEASPLEPISSGMEHNGSSYGAFNPDTTVDMTKLLGDSCNGKEKCSYKFEPELFPGGKTCPGHTQLISTYACVPKGSACSSYKRS